MFLINCGFRIDYYFVKQSTTIFNILFCFMLRFNVLQISSGIDNVGYPSWYMAVSMVVAWVLVFLCIFKGVKSIGKVIKLSRKTCSV